MNRILSRIRSPFLIVLIVIVGVLLCAGGYFLWKHYAHNGSHGAVSSAPDAIHALPGTVMQVQSDGFILRIYDSQAYGSKLLTRKITVGTTTQILLKDHEQNPDVYALQMKTYQQDIAHAQTIKDPNTARQYLSGHPAPDQYAYVPAKLSSLMVGDQVVVIAAEDIRNEAGITPTIVRIQSKATSATATTTPSAAANAQASAGSSKLLGFVEGLFSTPAKAQVLSVQGRLYWDGNWYGNTFWCDSGFGLVAYHADFGNTNNSNWVACQGYSYPPPPPPPAPIPTVSLWGSSNYVQVGTGVGLYWASSDASSCYNNFGVGGISGSATVVPYSNTQYYEVCDGPGGESVAYYTVYVYPAPVPDLISNIGLPSSATTGQTVTIGGYIVNQGPALASGNWFPNSISVWYNAGQTGDSGASTFSAPWLSGAPSGSWQYISAPYTFSAPGTYYFRICANSSTPWGTGNVISESNYGNDCSDTGNWYSVSVTNPAQADLTVGAAPTVTAVLGQPIPLSGTVINQGNGSTGTTFHNIFVTNLNAAQTGWNTIQDAGVAAALGSGASEAISTTLPGNTFSAPGSYLYQYCADYNAAWVGTIAESNENNNCITGSISVTAPAPSCSLSASPTSVALNQPSTLTWNSQYANTTTGSGFSTGNAASGSIIVTPGTLPASYGLQCVGPGGTTNAAPVTIGNRCAVSPLAMTMTASQSRVNAGTSVTFNWTASNVQGSSCTVTDGTAPQTVAVPPDTCSIPSGTITRAIEHQTTYTITCDGQSKTVTVNVIPAFNEF